MIRAATDLKSNRLGRSKRWLYVYRDFALPAPTVQELGLICELLSGPRLQLSARAGFSFECKALTKPMIEITGY